MLPVITAVTGGLNTVLDYVAELAILMFEYIGVAIITVTGIRAIISYLKRKPNTKLILAEGLALGLEFKLGSEILRTVILRTMSEIAITGGIIGLRAALTLLLHWEIRNERHEEAEEAAAREAEEAAAGDAEKTAAIEVERAKK